MAGDFEGGSIVFDLEIPDARDGSTAAVVADEELVFASKVGSSAGIVGEAGGAVSEVSDRRGEVAWLGVIVGLSRIHI